MTSSKFIIGLGSEHPSTRVLKPPGGDCSNLFDLNTRQKAREDSQEKLSLEHDMHRQREYESGDRAFSSDQNTGKSCGVSLGDHHHYEKGDTICYQQKNEREKTTSKDFVSTLEETSPAEQITKLQNNKTGERSELSEVNVDDSFTTESLDELEKACREMNSKLMFSEELHPKRLESFEKASLPSCTTKNSKDQQRDERFYGNQRTHVRTQLESTMNIFEHNSAEGPESQRKEDQQNSSNYSRNSKCLPPPSPGSVVSKRTLDKASSGGNSECQLTVEDSQSEYCSRNPITGELSQVTKKLTRTAVHKCPDVINHSDMNASIPSKNSLRRNPITGEGTESNLPSATPVNFLRSGVRIRQPPGGNSSGIF